MVHERFYDSAIRAKSERWTMQDLDPDRLPGVHSLPNLEVPVVRAAVKTESSSLNKLCSEETLDYLTSLYIINVSVAEYF
jgi:hypothetical protein